MNETKAPAQADKVSLRALLTLAVFALALGGFFLLNLIVPPPEVLESERRLPATLPPLSAETLLSGEYMQKFEDYANDRFVFRDALRTVRTVAVLDVFLQTDKSGLYIGQAGAGQFEKINRISLGQSVEKINLLAGGLEGLNLYVSFVPDKSVYAGRPLPGFDPAEARQTITQALPNLTFVDLTDALSAEDFYFTDLHWDQARLGGVLDALGRSMGFPGGMDLAFTPYVPGDFQGVYTGQIALPLPPDAMTVMTGGPLDGVRVTYLNDRTGQMEDGPLYDFDAFQGRDPYDLFLRGVQPLIVLENPAAGTGRELYLFRDSFSSSLAPLLTPYYDKITLIDLRYMDSRILPALVTFTPGSDVLFLYSSQILNHAEVLLVK
ncbi:MAG: hypothetical protein LBT60_07710 [Oscillospiraceae bacterium]|jgi:hypothetical protein|nr:hypothetical protein [Oscillospiraceae bacterium]